MEGPADASGAGSVSTDAAIQNSAGPDGSVPRDTLDALNRQVAQQVVTEIPHRMANRLRDFRSLGLQLLGPRQVTDVY